MEKPCLVASDVDGTLLKGCDLASARTARTVRRVVASDTPFILVTGRPPRWVPRVTDTLGTAGITVCSNGAVIYDAVEDLVLRSIEIDPVSLREVMHEVRKVMPECVFAVERSTKAAQDRLDEQFLAEDGFRRAWPNRDLRVCSSDDLAERSAAKLLVLHEALTSAEMAVAAESAVGSRLPLTYSTDAGLIEFSAPGADKAAGLASVVAECGIEPEDVIAFGDMPNDIPMLDWAGHGVAVRNGHPDVLEIADEVTAANTDDGVAQVLERWW